MDYAGVKYALLLGGKSKLGGIQIASSKNLGLSVDCRRWHENAGLVIVLYSLPDLMSLSLSLAFSQLSPPSYISTLLVRSLYLLEHLIIKWRTILATIAFQFLEYWIIFIPPCIVITTWMQGYNGSQLWDTAFAVQAIISTNIAEQYGPTLRKAHEYIKDSQVPLCRNLAISWK